jgi:L-lactate dehydrogenase complex protein LldF
VCPVKINIPGLLLYLRSQAQERVRAPQPEGSLLRERTLMRLWAWAMKRPWAYSLGSRLARLGQRFIAREGWIRRLTLHPLSGWTKGRDLPALAPKTFRERWKEMGKQ